MAEVISDCAAFHHPEYSVSRSNSGCTGCTDRGWTNCGLPQHLTSKTCVPLATMTHINHYAYQSQQAWASKTTNNVIKRRGDVPIFYEQVEDRAALQMVQSRVHLVHDLNASRDAQCLLDLFFRGTTHGRELSSPTQLPETSHGSATFEPTFQSKLRRMLHEASIQSPPQRPAEFRTVNAKGTCATDSSGFKCRKRLGCCGSLGLLPSNASLVAAYIQHFIVDDAGATNVHAGVLARAMRTTCTERRTQAQLQHSF